MHTLFFSHTKMLFLFVFKLRQRSCLFCFFFLNNESEILYKTKLSRDVKLPIFFHCTRQLGLGSFWFFEMLQ